MLMTRQYSGLLTYCGWTHDVISLAAGKVVHVSATGTVRENLDPAGQHSERELIAALKAVKLWEVLAGVSLSQAKAADAPHHGTPAAATAAPIAATVSQAVTRSLANSTPITIQGEGLCRRAARIPACQPQLAKLLML
jgi:hypothetical protein